MKNFVIFLIIIVMIGLMIIPFYSSESINDILAIVANLISALASIFTLVIALLLYSKYGIEKSLISKQTEVVLDLLIELKKINFVLVQDKGKINFMNLSIDLLDTHYFNEYIDTYLDKNKNKKLFFDDIYIQQLYDLKKISNNIFLPPVIAYKLSPLLFYINIYDKDRDSQDGLFVSVSDINCLDSSVNFSKLNGEDIILDEFIDRWIFLIREIKKWLKDHSNVKIDLNF